MNYVVSSLSLSLKCYIVNLSTFTANLYKRISLVAGVVDLLGLQAFFFAGISSSNPNCTVNLQNLLVIKNVDII